MAFSKRESATRTDAEVLRLLNPKEVARKLGTTPQTINRWARGVDTPAGFPAPRADGTYREWQIDRFVSDSRIGQRVVAL